MKSTMRTVAGVFYERNFKLTNCKGSTTRGIWFNLYFWHTLEGKICARKLIYVESISQSISKMVGNWTILLRSILVTALVFGYQSSASRYVRLLRLRRNTSGWLFWKFFIDVETWVGGMFRNTFVSRNCCMLHRCNYECLLVTECNNQYNQRIYWSTTIVKYSYLSNVQFICVSIVLVDIYMN